jgi:biopolymer transport protein ExbD
VALAAAAAGLAAVAAGVIIYLATDTGRLEINNDGVEMNGARIVLLKDGEEYASIDVEPGTKRQTIRAGEYEVALRGAPPGVELDVRATKKGRPHDYGSPTRPRDKVYAVYRGGGMSIEIARVSPPVQPPKAEPTPLTIGMNKDLGMLFQGRLVAPAELTRELREALKENPDREVAIDLPKNKWTVVGHVDQLEQIARTTGAQRITRPAWSEIRIRFGVINGSAQYLDINGPGYSASGFAKSYLPNVREVITKNPGLPVLLDVADGVNLADARIAEGFDELRKVAAATGAEVRVARTPDRAVAESPNALVEEVRLDGLQDFVLGLAFTPTGSHLVTSGADGAAIWNARNGRRIRELPHQNASVHAVAVSQDGLQVVAAGKGNAVILSEFATGAEIARFTGHTGFVECVAFSPDGNRLAAGSSNWVRKERGDVTVRVWDVETGREIWKADLPRTSDNTGMVYDVMFTPGGEQLVTVHHGPQDGISLFDAATGELQRRFSGSHSSIQCAALSPDGKMLATGHEAVAVRLQVWNDPQNAVIRLWELKTGREIGRLVGHTGGIQSLDFSFDGQRLLSCSGGQFLNDAYNPHPSSDNSLRVWDIATRQELIRQPLKHHGQRAVFSSDSRYIASSSGEVGEPPLVQIWRLPESAPALPSQYFQHLAGERLESAVRERVGGGAGRKITADRIPQPPGRIRYDAQIDGVGSKIIDDVFVDLRDVVMRGTDAKEVHHGEQGIAWRLLRYTTPTNNGEVRVTLISRELGGQPADESTKWLLKIEAAEWVKGEGKGTPVVVNVEGRGDQMKLSLDGAPLSREELLTRLNALATGDPGIQVHVGGDVVPVNKQVMDLVREIGVAGVGESNVKFSPDVTRRIMDDAVQRGKAERERKNGNQQPNELP